MAEEKFAAAEFEANRARLRAVAYRMAHSGAIRLPVPASFA